MEKNPFQPIVKARDHSGFELMSHGLHGKSKPYETIESRPGLTWELKLTIMLFSCY